MTRKHLTLLAALIAGLISSASFAESALAPDRDMDDDGLIEINNWADLNELRNNTSVTLYGSNIGCPSTGCTGYELTADLDFDTNGNGKFDANDTYWNNGAGWDPLATSNAEFEGNGHLIRNLIVNNQAAFGGLFGFVKNLDIRNLGLTGKLMSIEGIAYAGGLVGLMDGGSVTGSFSTGRVMTTGNYAGGLVGASHGTAFKAVFSSALVDGAINGGGLVGSAEDATTIDSSYAVGKTPLHHAYYGLASGGTVTNSYWALDAKGDDSRITNIAGGAAATLAELKCSTSALVCCPRYVACSKPSVAPLFVAWGRAQGADGNTYWDLGAADQLPGLVLNGTLYRDSDGNGVLDSDQPISSSASSSSFSSKSSQSISSLAGNVAPVIEVTGRWATQIWDDVSHWDASATTDADRDTLSFKWDFGDGKTAVGAVVSHTYYKVGLFTPSLTVSDGNGGVSTMSWTVQTADSYASSKSSVSSSSAAVSSVQILSSASFASVSAASSSATSFSSSSFSGVVENVAPVIKVKAYWARQIWDDWSRLDASETTDANGDTLTFKWDFGDDRTAEGASVSHTYYRVALYTPTLTVDDGHGGVSTMSWTVQTMDSYASSKSSSSLALSSSSASSGAVSSANSSLVIAPISSLASSAQGSASAASSSNVSAAASDKTATEAGTKSAGGSVNMLILVLLSALGFAWRGKKAA